MPLLQYWIDGSRQGLNTTTIDGNGAESPIPSEKGMEFYVNGDKVCKAVAMALDPEKIITVDVKKQDKDGVSTGQVWIGVKE